MLLSLGMFCYSRFFSFSSFSYCLMFFLCRFLNLSGFSNVLFPTATGNPVHYTSSAQRRVNIFNPSELLPDCWDCGEYGPDVKRPGFSEEYEGCLTSGQYSPQSHQSGNDSLYRVKDVDRPLSRTGTVYRVPCSCEKQYIGETNRALGTRTIEHLTATERGETEKSAVAEHA